MKLERNRFAERLSDSRSKQSESSSLTITSGSAVGGQGQHAGLFIGILSGAIHQLANVIAGISHFLAETREQLLLAFFWCILLIWTGAK